MFYKIKNITLIGLGISTLSCLRYLNSLNIEFNINIIDKDKIPKLLLNKNININNIYKKNIKLHFGNKSISYITNIIKKSDYLIISPSININNNIYNLKKIKKYYNIKIINDFDIFFYNIKNYNKIILVTGTNGKSTIVNIIYKILVDYNFKVFLGGNIGIPVLDSLDNYYDYYIIEISSFQIDNISIKYKNLISIISNIDYDHINIHKNFNEYKNIKLKVFDNSLYCIYNIKYKNFIKYFNNKKYISFGFKNSYYNIKKYNNNLYLYKNNEKIINCNKLKILGIENYLNILASLAVADILNINKESQISSIKNIKNLKYRFNVIKIKNNIWINDSKSTNLHSTIFAIKNVKYFFKYKIIHLILGGDRKNINFYKIIKFIKNDFIIYCYGKDGLYISKLLKNSIFFNDLESLFCNLINKINKNDIILFSPACSSLDQYKNFEHRGYFFNRLIYKYYKK